jgi:disulfide bond formation protein DsbB
MIARRLGAIGDGTRLLLAGLMLMASGALVVALIGEHVFAIEPCILCLYQRAPYVIVALFAAAGLVLPLSPRVRRLVIVLCALVLAAGAALAFYSVGVEEQWWAGVAGCEGTIPTITTGQDLQDLLKQPARGLRACDEDVWRLFGVSLAGYNVLVQAAVAFASLVALCWLRGPRQWTAQR